MPGTSTCSFALAHSVSDRIASANSHPSQVSRLTLAYIASDPLPAMVAAAFECAQRLFGVKAGESLRVQSGNRLVALTVGGSVGADTGPLAVIDLAGNEQDTFTGSMAVDPHRIVTVRLD